MDWLGLLFPKKCVNCGRWGGYVCDRCQVGLWEEEQICPVCGRNSRYGLRHTYCRKSYALDGLTCLWAYEGIARKIITKVKYKFYFDYLQELLISNDEFLNRVELSFFKRFLQQKPVVVPVPLHPSREKWRGFNQAAIISKLVARSWKLGARNLLVKTEDTGQQVGKTRQERFNRVKDAFSLKSDISDLGSVLLVDDVWTTGATLSECCQVLKKAGVKQVWGLVLAR